MWDWALRKRIDRTRTGLLLLIVGSALGWIPIVGIVGGILSLVGVILVMVGRKAFGRGHGRNTIIAVLLFALSVVGFVVLYFILGFAIASAVLGTPDLPAIRSAVTTYFWGAAVLAVVGGLWSVLVTYALQKPLGRVLLWAGYVSSSALAVAILVLVAPGLPDAVVQAVQTGGSDPFALGAAVDAALAPANQWGLLGVVPSLLFAAAYYLAWDRIKRGEIPEQPTPTATALPPA